MDIVTEISNRPWVRSGCSESERTGAFEVQLIEIMAFGRTFAVEYEPEKMELRIQEGCEKDKPDNASGSNAANAEAAKESKQA